MRGGPASPFGASWMCAVEKSVRGGEGLDSNKEGGRLTGSISSTLILSTEAIERDLVAEQVLLAIDAEVVISDGAWEAAGVVEAFAICCGVDDLVGRGDHRVRRSELLLVLTANLAFTLAMSLWLGKGEGGGCQDG